MIKVSINNKSYKVKNLPFDITVKEAISVASIDFDLTEEMLNRVLHLDPIKNDMLETDERLYICKVIHKLSDIPFKVLVSTDDFSLVAIFEYVSKLVDIIYFQNFDNYTPYGLAEIKHKEVVYELPEPLEIDEKNIQAYRESSKNIIEAGNIVNTVSNLSKNGIKYMPILCAIYLQEKDSDRVYNEKEIAERSKVFLDLPFGVALDVFFFIYYYFLNFVMLSRLSLLPLTPKQKLRKVIHTILGYLKLQSKV